MSNENKEMVQIIKPPSERRWAISPETKVAMMTPLIVPCFKVYIKKYR